MQQQESNTSSSNSLSSSFRALTSGGSLTWKTTKGDNDSRHRTDYKILKELGRGGFGKVYLVEHKLDGKLYAMKVVAAPSSDMDFNKVLREVQVLSSIQNEHVVRYYSAWVEKTNNGDHLLTSSTTTSTSFGDSNGIGGSSASSSYTNTGVTEEDDDRDGISAQKDDPVCNLCQSNYKDWEVSFESWGLIDAVLQPLDLCVECYKKNIPEDIDTSTITIRLQSQMLRNYLCIVMEYCESILMDIISSNTNSTTTTSASSSASANKEDGEDGEDLAQRRKWSLFGQILEGFTHLHANGVIHRDIKPSNIFIHNNDTVKIGDLGLAITHSSSNQNKKTHKPSSAAAAAAAATTTNTASATFASSTSMATSAASSTSSSSKETTTKSNSKSSNVGTFLYTAPEIQTSKHYDEKADIYSLGILLVEIFYQFTTGMERVKVLSDIRTRLQFPDDFITKYPIQYGLAKRMLQTNPKLRPSCLDILQELEQLGKYHSSITKTTTNLVEHLQSRIVSLQDTIRQQDEELNRLRQLLTNNNISF